MIGADQDVMDAGRQELLHDGERALARAGEVLEAWCGRRRGSPAVSAVALVDVEERLVLRIVGKHLRRHGDHAGARRQREAQRELQRLAIGDDLRVRPLRASASTPSATTVSRAREQLRDRRRLLRRDRRIEQPFGRIDVQVVREVEDVRDQRAFDRVRLQPEIEIAERHRMRRCRRAQDSRAASDHDEMNAETRGARRQNVSAVFAGSAVRVDRVARRPMVTYARGDRARRLSLRALSRRRRAARARRSSAARWSTAPCPRTCRSCAAAARCTCACSVSAATGTARPTATRRTGTDFDDLPAPPLPGDVRGSSRRAIAAAAGMTFEPDLCILNYYDADGRMGLHQDKDESERVDRRRAAGRLGVGRRHRAISVRRAAAQGSGRVAAARVRRRVRLRRPGAAALSRRVAHLPATAPPELELAGRFNLTFRQF